MDINSTESRIAGTNVGNSIFNGYRTQYRGFCFYSPQQFSVFTVQTVDVTVGRTEYDYTICRSRNGLISTIAISLNGKVEYALEGSVFVGGAVIQWVRDGLRMIQESRDAEYYAQKVPDNGGVYIVPAFTGLGAPYWDMYARGAIVGITRGTTQNHIIRAAEESIAYQSYDLVHAMELDVGQPITALKVDGGASRDQFLMQFQADILNKTVLRPAIRETTALGAAYLAGLATGVWKDRGEIRSLWHCNMTFAPQMDEAERTRLLAGWHKAVGRSCDWAEH